MGKLFSKLQGLGDLFVFNPFSLRRKEWGERRGSNPRQPAPQAGALPTELLPPLICIMQSGQASDNTIHIYIFDIIVCECNGLDQPLTNNSVL